GVAPMSLYRHVKDKGDLLDQVVDRLLGQAWQPRASRSNWRAWEEEAADKFRCFLVSQPAALDVYLSHPVVSPTAVERMETMMSVLRAAGFDDAAAKRAYASIHTYTLGFSALEASRSRWAPPEGQVPGLAKQLAAYTTPRQFIEGLSYLLDGIGKPAADGDQKKPRRRR
ncbi:MAG TPA: TetR/AcrR family transcriptional regulator C-terminal domain-containing protein, partial [Acidimicrobiales bacterium]|nr:TetR/AcrR family transcriptional regulator C-terminal domain-containing protein [Acidimicrobiales bacterium]